METDVIVKVLVVNAYVDISSCLLINATRRKRRHRWPQLPRQDVQRRSFIMMEGGRGATSRDLLL